jgi:hypothetical protein
MSKLLLPLTVLIAIVSLTGCSLFGKKDKKPKSSAKLYQGDSPSLYFTDEPETAGGPFNPH